MKDESFDSFLRGMIVVGCVAMGGLLVWLAWDLGVRRNCYASPMGGVPVDPVEFEGHPYVCGWTATGYTCRRMESCQ
jgi:hypothetical protein